MQAERTRDFKAELTNLVADEGARVAILNAFHRAFGGFNDGCSCCESTDLAHELGFVQCPDCEDHIGQTFSDVTWKWEPLCPRCEGRGEVHESTLSDAEKAALWAQQRKDEDEGY